MDGSGRTYKEVLEESAQRKKRVCRIFSFLALLFGVGIIVAWISHEAAGVSAEDALIFAICSAVLCIFSLIVSESSRYAYDNLMLQWHMVDIGEHLRDAMFERIEQMEARLNTSEDAKR